MYGKVIWSYLQAFCKFSGWEGTSFSCQGTTSLPNLSRKDNSNYFSDYALEQKKPQSKFTEK